MVKLNRLSSPHIRKGILVTFFLGFITNSFCQSKWWPVINDLETGVDALHVLESENKLLVGSTDISDDGGNIHFYENGSLTDMDIGIVGTTIRDFEVFNDTLLAIGTNYINDSVYGIGYWNGQWWAPFNKKGAFFQLSSLRDLQIYHDKLYIGGRFNYAVGLARSLGYYSSGSWQMIHTHYNGWVNCLKVFNDKLYAGGLIDSINGVAVNDFAVFNDTVWKPGAVNKIYHITSLEVHKNKLYGVSNSGVLYRLDDSIWVKVAVPNNRINVLKSTDAGLVVGGNFTMIDSISLNRVAILTDTGWIERPNQFSNPGIGSIEVFNGELFVGGEFKDLSDINIVNMARWGLPLGIKSEALESQFRIYPNPSDGSFFIEINPSGATQFNTSEQGIVSAYNTLGKKVYDQKIPIAMKTQIILPEAIGSGIYFIQLITGQEKNSVKLVVRRP